jgi:molybdopterin-guanine dinucleotide biosynthesis protein A
VIGLKVTTIHGSGNTCPRGGKGCGVCSSLDGDYCITRETDRGSDKDTVKLLEAGAREVYWLRVRSGRMDSAVKALKEAIPDGWPVIAESNTLRRVVKPGVFFVVKPRGSNEIKPSAKGVLEYADRIVEGDRERTSIDLSDITFTEGRFILRRAATLVLLAGGGSRRMGVPKSLLEYRGSPLITYIYKCLSPVFSEVLVSISGDETIPEELEQAKIVIDEMPGLGPIAGVAACLSAARNEVVFVTACDIPTIHYGLVTEMLDLSKGYDVVVPRTGEGFIEPLHAVYNRCVLPKVRELVDSGERRIRMLYDRVNTCYKDLEPDQNLYNINTPEEYRSIRGLNEGFKWR